MGASGTRKEIVDTYNILREIDVEPSPMIRPPAMKYKSDLVQALDYEFILWSIDAIEELLPELKGEYRFVTEVNYSIF